MHSRESHLYTQDFYKAQQEGSRKSAKEIIPLILELIQPQSVIDVGCGVGTWLSVFKEFGIKHCLGIDGDYIDKNMLQIPSEEFLSYDLKKPISIDKNFELVVSLEVAEHLPSECAETFIKSLTRLGEVILFSAAIPFQGGTGHLNEQWPEYWVQYFQKQGYLVVDYLRKKIWNNEKVEFWYAQNILIFVKNDCLHKYPLINEILKKNDSFQLSIVHPNLYLGVLNSVRLVNTLSTEIETCIEKQSPQRKPKNLPIEIAKNCKKQLNIATSPQSKPRIDVVLQATGLHGWSCSRGWANVLQREGLLNRVFTPIADWGADEPKYDDGLFEYLKNPQADIMLLLGFGWHSQPLHNSRKWQEQWSQASITKLAVLQECYSSKLVQNTPQWQQMLSDAIDSTIPCVDGLICHHEPDVHFLQRQKNISLPIVFLPFGVDNGYFKIKTTFDARLNRSVFRGNIAPYFTEKTYSDRRQFLKVLNQCQNVDLFQFHCSALANPIDEMQRYVDELNRYRLLLNLPSMSPTLTSRPFEIMACGGVLLQNKIIGEQSNNFFQDWEHIVYYEPENPDDLINKIKFLVENPDIAQKIAAQGHKLCQIQHTISNRIASILDLLGYSFQVKTNFTESILIS
jgi:SAM-dependent methyltransferase